MKSCIRRVHLQDANRINVRGMERRHTGGDGEGFKKQRQEGREKAEVGGR